MKTLSPVKTIKKYCKEQCCIGDTKSWKECPTTTCLLHRYRFGIGNRSSAENCTSTSIEICNSDILAEVTLGNKQEEVE